MAPMSLQHRFAKRQPQSPTALLVPALAEFLKQAALGFRRDARAGIVDRYDDLRSRRVGLHGHRDGAAGRRELERVADEVLEHPFQQAAVTQDGGKRRYGPLDQGLLFGRGRRRL